MKIKQLTLVLASALLLGTTQAHALLITAEATTRIGADPALTDTASGSGSPPIEATSYSSDGIFESWASTAGDDTGWMYAQSLGSGSFQANTTLIQSETFTNPLSVPALYTFDFNVSPGSLLVSNWEPLLPDEIVWAGYSASILVNGTTLWSSAAELLMDENGVTFNSMGEVLGSYTPGSVEYSWSDYNDTLFLGVFAPGETLTVEYLIQTFAVGTTDIATDCGLALEDGGFIRDGFENEDGAFTCGNGFASARFGDPTGINVMPINNSTVNATPVPVSEPATALLMLAGLAGAGMMRRRKGRETIES